MFLNIHLLSVEYIFRGSVIYFKLLVINYKKPLIVFSGFFVYLLKLLIMARLTEYKFDLCLLICEEIAKGGNIMNVLDSNDVYPSWSTFRRWKRDNEELRTLYVNSQQDKAEALEKEMDDYRCMLLAKEIDASTYNTLVQTLKWKMSKYYAKMYGDKIQQEHSGEVKGNNTLSLNITMPDGKTIDDFKID